MPKAEIQLIQGSDARKEPVRLLVVQEDVRPAVDVHDDELVMTFPHLLVRELIALVAASLVIVLCALLFDAPLEELANPQKTPNPAKAPWYFLGLQELLHYYPPLISGVILPGLAVAGLVIIPYFNINLRRDSVYYDGRNPTTVAVTLLAVGAALTLVFYFSGAHPVWPLIGPTWLVIALMIWPALERRSGLGRWLGTRSLPFWIFFWFLLTGVVLTVIGVFFRGPGWQLTVPWIDGIYY